MEHKEIRLHTIPFDPGFLGGRQPEDYQKIAVALPEGFSKGYVELSVDYHAATELSQFPPHLFIADAHVGEDFGNHDTETFFLSDEILGGKSQSSEVSTWFVAETNINLQALKPAFIRFGTSCEVLYSEPVTKAHSFFDAAYYKAKNLHVDFALMEPFTHYLYAGWKESCKPNPEFSVREYLLRHPEVEGQDAEPLLHYANLGQQEGFSLGVPEEKVREIWEDSGKPIPVEDEAAILSRAQDMMVPMDILEARKLVVFVVPEHDAMSGGIYSFFSIAAHVRRTRAQHGYDVLVMTRPNPEGLTYIRNSAFTNSETVLRLEQIRLFSEVSDLQLHIPEYATVDFVHNLSHRTLQYLLSRNRVHINILNQNTRLMPRPSAFHDLRRISDTIGQSVSHHAFFGQDFADHYGLPTLLLPAYTDLTPYPASPAEQKENLIIHSADDAPYKCAVLEQLSKLDDYKLIKIENMTFDQFMDLATRCRFSVSFGEGFDGYVAQPMYQGGIGLALYNEEFFPDESYSELENFFGTEEEMIAQIVPTIRRLEADLDRYKALNRMMRTKWEGLYSYDDYVARIGKLIRKEYEIWPKKMRMS